jgi:putative ABC transport system permease protein
MKFRTFFMLKLAFKNIRLNWRHSLATSLAIMVGFSAVCLFDGFMNWLREYNLERYVNKGMVGHVVVGKKGGAEHLTEDPWLYSLNLKEQATIAEWLTADPRVQTAARFLMISGLLSNGKNSALFYGGGLEEEKGILIRGEKWKWNTIAGKPLYLAPANSFLIGKGLAQRMDCSPDDKEWLNPDGSYMAKERPVGCVQDALQISVTTEHSQANAVTLRAVGVVDMQLRELNDKVLLLPLVTAQQLMDTNRITRFQVLLKSPDDAPGFIADMDFKAKAAGLDFEFIPWLKHPIASAARGGTEILHVFRNLFLSIVAVIAAMSVANSMMKSINERIREIGTLRSFGFRRLDIRLLFSFEGLLLGFFSCIGGIGMSWILTILVQNMGLTVNAGILSTPMPVTVSIPLNTWIFTAATLSLITFIASWVVSGRAAKMIIADALRHVA